jgi:hypothetical protein
VAHLLVVLVLLVKVTLVVLVALIQVSLLVVVVAVLEQLVALATTMLQVMVAQVQLQVLLVHLLHAAAVEVEVDGTLVGQTEQQLVAAVAAVT